MNKVWAVGVISLFFQQAFGQHAVDFSVQNEVCLGEKLQLQNNSDEGLTVEWDFCAAQLEGTYTTEARGSVTPIMTDISIVNDSGSWYGFAVSRNNLLYKIHYGNSPANAPESIESLGNPGSLLSSPEGIDVLKDGNNWYAFITNIGNDIIRLNWGNSLHTIPIGEKLNLTGYNKLNGPVQIEVVKDNEDFVAIVANVFSSTVTLINFGSSLGNFPADTDVIESVRLPNAFDTYGVSIVRVCDEWVAFAISSGRIYKIDIGSELFSPIYLDQISDFTSDLPVAIGSYNHIRATTEGENIYVYFTSYTGRNIAAAIWRSGDLHAEYKEIDDTFTFGLYGLDVYKDAGAYGIIVSGYDTGSMYHISITSLCSASKRLVNEPPVVISYSEPGTYAINLKVTFNDGVVCSKTKTIVVKNNQSPQPTIKFDNICVSSEVRFEVENTNLIEIDQWVWHVASEVYSSETPSHIFDATGNYPVELIVIGVNGCSNTADKAIKIYNAPVASFTLPNGLVCTNNEFLFENTTADSFDGNLSYQWFANNTPLATTRELTYAITTTGDQEVKLQTSIPGCMSESVQTLTNIQEGAVVGFEVDSHCEDVSSIFTNNSSGDIISYRWDFGDGQSGSAINPIHTYTSKGDFQVALHVSASNGCVSTNSQALTIYSKPQPNFSLDLPPFSCAGSPSQFNDLTPPLTDSNITSRFWSFGDANNGTSTQTNPTYTYNQAGDYPVSLEVASNFGCSSTIQKTITIQPSPTINFTNTPACLNQPTQFTDASGADVKAWLWTIQNSSYTTRNVIHEFSTTGLQNAMLTVTGNNDCVSEISKTITIPVPVSIDFTTQSTCATKPAVFMEKNSGGADPAVFSTWDFAGQPGSGSPAQHVFSSVGSFPVKLSSTRLSGCVYSVTKSVNIIQPPVAHFTMTPEIGGVPLAVGFTNTSSSATNFLWKFNDVSNTTSTQSSPSFVFDQLGTYAIELIASNAIGCTDSVKKDVHVVVPQINAVLSGFWLKGNADGTLNATVTVENKGNITITNPEVYLDLSGVTEVKERISGTIPPNQSITRTLTSTILPVNLKYACAEVFITEDANTFDNRECTNLENEITFIQPYPNPANDIIYLDWINQDLESIQFIIYNSTGQAVLNQTYSNLLQGLNQVEINVSQLAPGIYLASYSTGNNLFSFRFSVNR